MLRKRKLAFCDKSFLPSHAGSDFPRNWTSGFRLEQGLSPAVLLKLRQAMVQLQVDQTFQETLRKDVLPIAAPEFQKSTEDGTVCLGARAWSPSGNYGESDGDRQSRHTFWVVSSFRKVWKWLQSGLRFRIYRLGSLEVRTIQAPEQSEELGVVFSSRAVTWDLAAKPTSLREDEKIVTYLTYHSFRLF